MNRLATPIKRLFFMTLSLGFTLLGGTALAEVELEHQDGLGYPRDISIDGWRIDWLIDITMLFVTILFVIMCLWMAYCWFFHDEKHEADYDHGQSKHHVLTAIILSSVIFWVVDGNLLVNSIVDVRDAFWNYDVPDNDPETVRIEVQARQWFWQGRYAGLDNAFGTPDDIVINHDFKVPVDTPVDMQLASIDVIHGFYLPNLRNKMDCVPGMINRMWFEATETREVDIGCTQHCGTNHYKMKGKMTILPKDEFRAWYVQASLNAERAYDPNDVDANWAWPWAKGE